MEKTEKKSENDFKWYQWGRLLLLWPFLVIDWIRDKLRKKPCISICALGERQTGKTLWLKFLQTGKIPNETKQTNVDDFDAFDLFFEGDRELHVEKGTDIGGERSNRKAFYKDFIAKSDVICYFINIIDYLSYDDKNKYFITAKSGLDFVADLYIEAIKDSKKNRAKLPIIILSYADRLKTIGLTEEQALEKFKATINEKKFKIFIKNLYLVDLTNIESQKKLKDKIFKNFCNDEK